MTTITDTMRTVSGDPDNSEIVFFVPEMRPAASGAATVTMKRVPITPVNGAFSVTLDPGLVYAQIGSGRSPFVVPASGTARMGTLIAQYLPPTTTPTQVDAAITAWLEENPIEGGGLTVDQIATAATTSTPLKAALDQSYAPVFQPLTAYVAGQVVTANGIAISRIASGTSRASYDSTEQALWTRVVATPSDLTPLVTKPSGGTDGQVLARSGTAVVWATPSAASAGIAALSTLGDSITAAGQGGGIKWHELVSDWLGIPAFNPSVPGEAPADIAVRQGGLAPQITLTGNSIPATTDPVTVTTIVPSTGFITDSPGNALRGAFVGRLCGVAGTLKHDQSTGAWTFTRTAAGTVAINCPAGSTFRVDDSKTHRGDIQTFWGGRNGSSTLLRDTASMVAYLNAPKRFLVLSILTSGADVSGSAGYISILARNAQLAAAYPDNYFDIRGYLIASGLSDAGITPTTQDNADIAADTVPTSLRDDSIHPNAIGHWVIARRIAKFIVDKGWVDPASVYIPASLGTAVAPVVTTTTVPSALVGTAYPSTTLNATGTAPLTWSIASGALPSGITLNASTGVLSGTPTAGIPASFTVRATNSAGFDDQALTIAQGVPAGPTVLDMPTNGAVASIAAPAGLIAADSMRIEVVGHFDTLTSLSSIIRRLATAGDQRSWQLLTLSSMKLRMQMFQSGTSTPVVTTDSTLGVTFTAGALLGIRVDMDASVRSTAFYTTTDDVTWTQLGTTITGAATTLFDGTAPLELAGFAGDVKRVKVSTIDGSTVWVNEDFTDNSAAGWTLSGGAVLV